MFHIERMWGWCVGGVVKGREVAMIKSVFIYEILKKSMRTKSLRQLEIRGHTGLQK